jgi:hypothetical protein
MSMPAACLFICNHNYVSFCINIYGEQFYRVQVGLQSPEGITTTRGILRRFNDFLKLSSEVSDISFLASLMQVKISMYQPERYGVQI